MSLEADDLMSTEEVAGSALLRVKSQTLRAWRVRGTGPKYVKIGRRVYYRLSDIRAWIDGRLRTGTTKAAVR